jgi:hypothetical protein
MKANPEICGLRKKRLPGPGILKNAAVPPHSTKMGYQEGFLLARDSHGCTVLTWLMMAKDAALVQFFSEAWGVSHHYRFFSFLSLSALFMMAGRANHRRSGDEREVH